MTDHIWKFRDKNTNRESLYGNLRKLWEQEIITIDGQIKNEDQLRYLLRKEKDKFSNKDYLIVKTLVTRSNFKRK